jgi:hypothetical protein
MHTMTKALVTYAFAVVMLSPDFASSFMAVSQRIKTGTALCGHGSEPQEVSLSRRNSLLAILALAPAFPLSSRAEAPEAMAPEAMVAPVAMALKMKNFVDPIGLFSISTPEGFFTLRRSAKGDLPDEKTGKGRRGSSIFTAGNMAKAEVIAVERYVRGAILSSQVRTFFLQFCY